MRCRPRHRCASGNSNAGCIINNGSSVNENGATSTLVFSRRARESPTALLGRIADTNGPSLLCPSVSSRPVHNRSSEPHRRTVSSSARRSFLLVLVTFLNMSSLAVGLVIEKPFQETLSTCELRSTYGCDCRTELTESGTSNTRENNPGVVLYVPYRTQHVFTLILTNRVRV